MNNFLSFFLQETAVCHQRSRLKLTPPQRPLSPQKLCLLYSLHLPAKIKSGYVHMVCPRAFLLSYEIKIRWVNNHAYEYNTLVSLFFPLLVRTIYWFG